MMSHGVSVCLIAAGIGMQPADTGSLGNDDSSRNKIDDQITNNRNIEQNEQIGSTNMQIGSNVTTGVNNSKNKVMVTLIAAFAGAASLLLNVNCTGGALVALEFFDKDNECKGNGEYL